MLKKEEKEQPEHLFVHDSPHCEKVEEKQEQEKVEHHFLPGVPFN